MAKKLLDKVMHMIGFEEEETEDNLQNFEEEPENLRKRKGTVVSLHTQKQMKVVIVEPLTFDDAVEAAEALKSRRPVIINLEHADLELARRILDFASGVTYALEGNMQKVGTGIFLFTPKNVEITPDTKFDGKDEITFPWKQQ